MLLRQRDEPARRRRLDGLLTRPRVVWVSPTAGAPLEAFAERLRPAVDLTLLELRVWGLAPGDGYGMDVEVAAVTQAAGSGPVHLAGFSAGATVALAAALALGDRVGSVALLEPASIGDDNWHPDEAEWRAQIRALGTSAAPDPAAFRDLLMAPGERAPAARTSARWDFRDDLLGAMITSRTGFTSSDLARIGAPILLVRGGRSAPQWGLMTRRLGAVCPDARDHVFPALHHFAPAFREEPEELADILRRLWGAGEAPSSR